MYRTSCKKLHNVRDVMQKLHNIQDFLQMAAKHPTKFLLWLEKVPLYIITERGAERDRGEREREEGCHFRALDSEGEKLPA